MQKRTVYTVVVAAAALVAVFLMLRRAPSPAPLVGDATSPATQPAAPQASPSVLSPPTRPGPAAVPADSAAPADIAALIASLEMRPDDFTRIRSAEAILKRLLQEERYEELEDLAVACLRGCVYATYHADTYQKLRMNAFLAQDRKEEALQAAKVLYNVARFNRTTDAVKDIAICLEKAHPRGEAAARDFRLYQQYAAHLPQNPPQPVPSALPANPLNNITVDPTPFYPYFDEHARYDTSAFGNARRGHLLLLMDRGPEAEKEMRLAWDRAPDRDRGPAAENLARAIRAADGGTGRALAFLLSLDPAQAIPNKP